MIKKNGVYKVPMAAITLADNIRTIQGLDDEAIEQLAESLKRIGQKTPVNGYYGDDGETVIIWNGQRRYRAAQVAGLDSLDVLIGEAPEFLGAAQLSTFDTADLSAYERVRAIHSVWLTELKPAGYTQEEAGPVLDCSQSQLSRTLALGGCADLMQVWGMRPHLPREAFQGALAAGKRNKANRGAALLPLLPSDARDAWAVVYGPLPEESGGPDKTGQASGARLRPKQLARQMAKDVESLGTDEDEDFDEIAYAYLLGAKHAALYLAGQGGIPLSYPGYESDPEPESEPDSK